MYDMCRGSKTDDLVDKGGINEPLQTETSNMFCWNATCDNYKAFTTSKLKSSYFTHALCSVLNNVVLNNTYREYSLLLFKKWALIC